MSHRKWKMFLKKPALFSASLDNITINCKRHTFWNQCLSLRVAAIFITFRAIVRRQTPTLYFVNGIWSCHLHRPKYERHREDYRYTGTVGKVVDMRLNWSKRVDIGKSSAEIFQVVTLIGSESLFLSSGGIVIFHVFIESITLNKLYEWKFPLKQVRSMYIVHI